MYKGPPFRYILFLKKKKKNVEHLYAYVKGKLSKCQDSDSGLWLSPEKGS